MVDPDWSAMLQMRLVHRRRGQSNRIHLGLNVMPRVLACIKHYTTVNLGHRCGL